MTDVPVTQRASGGHQRSAHDSPDLADRQFGRRPRARGATFMGPASENLHKSGRVCPLLCEHGFRADGDRCTKIVCRSSYEVGDDNICGKIARKPTASREDTQPKRVRPESSAAAPEKLTAPTSGQIVCNSAGCRPVQKGCHLEASTSARKIARQFRIE
jgi:hypothetical protein